MACWPASKVGQLLVLLPTSLDLTPRAAELGSLVTHEDVASIGMPCFAAPGAESNSAGRRRRAEALGYQIQGAVIQRCQEMCPVSGRIHSSQLDRFQSTVQALACTAKPWPQCSNPCRLHACYSPQSPQSPLCRITSKPAEKSAPQRSFCSNRAALQFFCNARRWPPKRRP